MDPLAIVLAAVTATVGLAVYLERRRRILRALARVPPRPIREARDGQPIRVVGRLGYLGQPLSAPLTGRTCAYYDARVEQVGGGSVGATLIIHDTLGQDFLLRDATGKAIVRLEAPEVVVTLDTRIATGIFDPPSPRLEAFLQRHGEEAKGLIFYRSLRFREGILEEGEQVTAFGVGRWERDPDPDPGDPGGGYRETPMRLVISPGGRIPLRVSDAPAVTRMGADRGDG